MSEVLWRRLRYMLTPQFDIYESIGKKLTFADVIDVGCGTGFGTLQLVRNYNRVTGVDIDADAIKFAVKCIPNVLFKVEDITHPIEKKYNVAVMIEVLEHISDWDAALTNVCDALKDYGELYISARNANADLRKNDLHEREWSAEQFGAALRKYFEDVKLYDYTLTEEQEETTRMTPLVAIAQKPRRKK